jgi:ribosomal protein S18 acetylase RimI-like enzyme
MTILVSMREQAFARFCEEAVRSYADDNVKATRWPEDTALDQARASFAHLLPDGLATPNHFFYQILETSDGPSIGALWFAVINSEGKRSGYVYNIRVNPAHRGRGHARAALLLMEEVARGLGISSIGLHVFGFNTGAQALYRSLGYGVTGFHMLKPLAGNGA